MRYLESQPFTVSTTGRGANPATCQHTWLDPKGACVMCGTQVQRTDETPDDPPEQPPEAA